MKKIIASLLACLLMFSLLGCQKYDGPPEDMTPEPDPLMGTYVSNKYGSMAFNGDGETVEVQFLGGFAEALGMDEEIHDGSYVFRLYNGAYRYDKAEDMQLYIDGEAHVLINSAANSYNCITVLSPIDGDASFVNFVRKSDETSLQ